MCGFVGFFGKGGYDRLLTIHKMSDRIIHRGPDSDGYFVDDSIALGFRRLSIIDLENGSQPMTTADGRYVIVFNGEIYNYRELREELIKEFGASFVTSSDTEVVLQSYAYLGEKVAYKLRGMFAFVVYDTVTKKIFACRDHFGIKPFYYAFMNGTLIFGSEIKSFLDHPYFKKEINDDALKMYLVFQYSPLEETIFKNVYKLHPGTYFVYENGEMTKTRYFKPSYDPKKRSFDDAVKLIDETVLSSVEYHQIADVEVGSFLSGGVDSSYIASTVRPMKTYSVGFDVSGFDETGLAHELSDILGMPNKTKNITPDEFFAALPAVQYHSDEPHANLSAVPLYFLSDLASKDLKVVLSGEGADEFFGGYDWYIQSEASRIYKKLPFGMRKFFASTIGKIPVSRVKRFFGDNAKKVEDTYIGQAFIMNDGDADELLNAKHRSGITYRDVTAPYYAEVKDADDLTKKMYLDMFLWLPYDILLKADKMTMAHSLEERVPYLDKEVWNTARTLTSKQKMKGRHVKRAFRSAALSHIPEAWANRKKAGFFVPFRVWLKDEKYASDVRAKFNSDYAAEFFDVEKLNKMLEDHISGRSNTARKVYTVYSFLIWYEQYFIKNKGAE